MSKYGRRRRIAALAATVFPAAAAAAPQDDIAAPPPVSGRSLSAPASITSADVLARVLLIRENLELIRQFVGRPAPPEPLLQVEDAVQREVFVQTYGLLGRSRQLGFEHLGTPMEALRPPDQNVTAALNLERLNEVLVTVLRVKQNLGVETVVAEKPQPISTNPSDAFNAIVQTAQLLDVLLDKKTDDADVFSVITFAFNLAAKIAVRQTRRFMVPEPAFVPNQTPSDVYRVLYRCYQELRNLAKIHDLHMLSFELANERTHDAKTSNVMELTVLIVAELIHLHRELLNEEPPHVPYFAGRRFPSHGVQRAKHLEAVLKNMGTSSRARGPRR